MYLYTHKKSNVYYFLYLNLLVLWIFFLFCFYFQILLSRIKWQIMYLCFTWFSPLLHVMPKSIINECDYEGKKNWAERYIFFEPQVDYDEHKFVVLLTKVLYLAMHACDIKWVHIFDSLIRFFLYFVIYI